MPADRRGRALALDPRLLVGLVLVAASVAAVVGIVGAADARVTVYGTVEALNPGDRVDAGDLVERSVALDGAEDAYLTAADIPDSGVVVTRTVAAGELVPVSAAATVDGVRTTALVLQLSSRVSEGVVGGARVDVWGAAAEGQGAYGPPVVLSSDAVVARVIEDDGLVASSAGVAIELIVPRSRVARLLQAIANGDALAVVPAGLSLGRR